MKKEKEEEETEVEKEEGENGRKKRGKEATPTGKKLKPIKLKIVCVLGPQ